MPGVIIRTPIGWRLVNPISYAPVVGKGKYKNPWAEIWDDEELNNFLLSRLKLRLIGTRDRLSNPRSLATPMYQSMARRLEKSRFLVARFGEEGQFGGCFGSQALGGSCVPTNVYWAGIGELIMISYQFPNKDLVQVVRQAPPDSIYWVAFRVLEVELFKVTVTVNINYRDLQFAEIVNGYDTIYCGDSCAIKVNKTNTFTRSLISDEQGRLLNYRVEYLDNMGLLNSDCYQGCVAGTEVIEGIVTPSQAADDLDVEYYDRFRVYVNSYSTLGANCSNDLSVNYSGIESLIFSRDYFFNGGIIEGDCNVTFTNITKCNNTVLGKVYIIELYDQNGVFHSAIGDRVLPNYANYPNVSIDTGTVAGGYKVLSQKYPYVWYSVPTNYSSCECGDFNQKVTRPPSPIRAVRDWTGTNAGAFNPCKHIMKVKQMLGIQQNYNDYVPNRGEETKRKKRRKRKKRDFRHW